MKNSYSGYSPWEIDYLKIGKVVLSRWSWITIALVCGWITAWLYLRYMPSLYTCRISLRFEDNRSEISELLQVKNRFYRHDKIEAEKFILQSYGVRMQAARLLNISNPVSFYSESNFAATDLYPDKLLDINILSQSEKFFPGKITFKPIGRKHFELSAEINGRLYQKKIRYGTAISLPGIKFKITAPVRHLPSGTYFKFNADEVFAERLDKGLRIEENDDEGIIHLKLTDANTHFAADALNHLAHAYLANNKAQRSASALQTIQFIDTLLLDMQKAVINTGRAVEEFKIKNNFLDLSTNAEHKALKLSRLETEKQQLELMSVNISSIEKNIRLDTTSDYLNFNIQGATDPMLITLVQQFNEVLLQKKEMDILYKPTSGKMAKIDEQIWELKSTILNNIGMQKEKNLESISYLDQQISKLKRSYRNLPVAERDFINLKSAFDVTQKIFNYLSEKKLEARISKAAATPSAFIIDEARPSLEVVSPNPGKVYTLATLGSLSVSLLLIFGSRILYPYIYDKETLEELTDIGVIGTVSSLPTDIRNSPFPIISITHSNTAFAESIRSVRTCLAFLATEKLSKIICITSEISGEGKSLISLNLAGALSLLEKKIIVIATDLRKSKMHQLFRTESNKGLSDYLAGTADIDEVIIPTTIKNLSFVSSGSIPPNPGELLFTEKMKQLLDILKQEYAFIILDTAPVGLVSDAMPLIRLSDINLFIIRAGFSRYKSAALPAQLKKTHGLANLYLLLNDVKSDFSYKNYYTREYDERV